MTKEETQHITAVDFIHASMEAALARYHAELAFTAIYARKFSRLPNAAEILLAIDGHSSSDECYGDYYLPEEYVIYARYQSEATTKV